LCGQRLGVLQSPWSADRRGTQDPGRGDSSRDLPADYAGPGLAAPRLEPRCTWERASPWTIWPDRSRWAPGRTKLCLSHRAARNVSSHSARAPASSASMTILTCPSCWHPWCAWAASRISIPCKLRGSRQIWSSRRSDSRSHLRSEEHTSELQSRGHLVCRLLLEKKKKKLK